MPSLSKRTLREIRDVLARQANAEESCVRWPQLAKLGQEIDRALKPSTKRQAARSSKAKEKKSRKATKAEETAEIRRAVFERANFRCEVYTCVRPASSMDHFFGRGKVPQSVENCWALCLNHDLAKTRNEPSSAEWLRLFIAHASTWDYVNEIARAGNRLNFVEARSGLSGVGR